MASPASLRHLPGQHDQQKHAGDDYRGSHTAANREYGAPMSAPDDMMPDVVAHPEWYGNTGSKKADAEAVAAIRKAVAGGPGTKLKVYRAVPDDVDAQINPGDWVTPSKTYAKMHGEGPLDGKYKIIQADVLAGDLFTEGNSIAEWGWDPAEEPQRSAFTLALGVVVRHLQGKHDQKTHGRKGAGESGGLPDGWAADEEGFTRTGTYQVQLSTGRGTITVEASVQNFWGGWGPPERPADEFTEIERQQIRDAVNRTAGHIDRLQRANPVDDLDVRITSGMPSRIGGRVPFGRGGVPLMEINANLYEGDQGVWKRCFENNSNVGLPDDVVGSIVTHEYGHVLQYQAASKEIPEWRASRGSEAVGLLSRETWQRAMDGFPGFRQGAYDQMSSYAKSSPVEAYAEAFAEWSLRDRRPMSPLAREIAELEGWQ